MFSALLVVPALLYGGFAATSARAGGDAVSFVAEANAERQARGLPSYVVRSDLTAVAARHSARMAPGGTLFHNPNLGSEVEGWRLVGENVGDGGSLYSIHQAFMDSPAHRANILATDYTEIGVGAVTDGEGVIWVTQVFRLPARARVPVVAALVKAPLSLTRAPGRSTASTPVVIASAYVAPARPVARPAPVSPDAFVAALAYGGPGPFGQALAYADLMAALAR